MSMLEARLIAAARDLCRRTGRRPRDAFMRRAVSTAYYAMFHALCRLCADQLIGGKHEKTPAWQRVYRAMEHKTAKNALLRKEVTDLHPALATFGVTFAILQDKRVAADYDPVSFSIYFDETNSLVDQADSAIKSLYGVDDDIKRNLAAILLIRVRQP
jgi:uncharacterized protein (UPF0332 family)